MKRRTFIKELSIVVPIAATLPVLLTACFPPPKGMSIHFDCPEDVQPIYFGFDFGAEDSSSVWVQEVWLDGEKVNIVDVDNQKGVTYVMVTRGVLEPDGSNIISYQGMPTIPVKI